MADLREQLERGLADRYRIERELGRGGMATVYVAQDLKHDRPVALKVLLPELGASLGPDRFQREIRLAARLQHPHILTVHDSGETGGQLWFTMPFVEGESLRDRLRRERQLGVEDALRITREAAQALQYAHDHGIVHRDIKPENLLLTKDGNTLVADFGIARALAGDEHLTQTGMSVGTPAYMSPEQASGDRSLDARTDIYSLGAVLYEMLAGEPPFTGPSAQAIIVKRLTEPVPSVRKVRPNVAEGVGEALQRALAPIAADRFTTAAEFAQALQPRMTATAAATTAGATPAVSARSAGSAASQAVTPARRLPVAALALGLGFLVGVGVLFAWRRSHSGGDEGAGPKRLAVLPFENLGDSADAYFADGITDEVRGKLSQVSGLAVIARASSNEYRATTKAPQQIARELGADYLLTATVRWEKASGGPSRVRVSPELIRVEPGAAPTTKWQQPFDASLTDVFQVQADIATKVASALNAALGDSVRHELAARPTENLAAYDAFLKGEASGGLTVADAPTLRTSIAQYERAVALDSTFAGAWSRLSRAQSLYYAYATPTPAGAEAAKHAAERAMALAPSHPESRLALGDYHNYIRAQYAEALAAYEEGLRGAPDNADLLTNAALSEQSLGRWDVAVTHLQHAAKLDPRSATTARRLAYTLLRLKRYPEALAVVERGLQLSPTNLDLLENKVMVYLAQGDLDRARAVLRSAPSEVEPTALVAFFGNYWDLFWVLDDEQQKLLLRLPPAVYDNDRSTWGIVRAQTFYLRGDVAAARSYADSARLASEELLRSTPEDPSRLALLGLALAYLGRGGEAMKAAEHAVGLGGRDGYTGPYLDHLLVRTYILVGEQEKALDRLEPLLKAPYHLSPGWLRIDPGFAPLRKNPRFQKLIAGAP